MTTHTCRITCIACLQPFTYESAVELNGIIEVTCPECGTGWGCPAAARYPLEPPPVVSLAMGTDPTIRAAVQERAIQEQLGDRPQTHLGNPCRVCGASWNVGDALSPTTFHRTLCHGGVRIAPPDPNVNPMSVFRDDPDP